MIRLLQASELDQADRIMRSAFGTYLGSADPMSVFGDAEILRPRFTAAPSWVFAAELDGEVVGSSVATRWGSFGFVGPLSVRPDLWGRGLASRLMEPLVGLFEQWEVSHAALFTFPESAKHIGLYQKFDFWPQHLTPLMEKLVAPATSPRDGLAVFSDLRDDERGGVLAACGALTDAILAGLDVGHEIRAANAQGIGDTLLLDDDSGLSGFAVCHLGAGEAGSGNCFVKFGAVRPGSGAGARFERLLDACEALAAARGLGRLVAGVNTARHDAYRRLLSRGYRSWREGVIMQRANDPGYCRNDVHVIDDLR